MSSTINEKYYLVVSEPKEMRKITKYMLKHDYKYYVETWISSPIPFDDEDDEVYEFHIIFSCTEQQSSQVQEDLKHAVYLYFGGD